MNGSKSMHENFPWSHETLSHYILYFSQLPREASTETFRDYLSEFGEVAWLEVFKKPRCRDAFAHVLFESKESYERVFRKPMHVFGNQKLRCSMWRRTGVNSSFEEILNGRKIFIKNLSVRYGEMDIFKYFKQFGTIENIEMPVSHHNNQKRHIAYVVFRNKSAVEECIREKARIKKEINFRVRAYRPEDSELEDQQKQSFEGVNQQQASGSEIQQLTGPVPSIELIKKQQNPESKALFVDLNLVTLTDCCDKQIPITETPANPPHPSNAQPVSLHLKASCPVQHTCETSMQDQNSTQASLVGEGVSSAKRASFAVEDSVMGIPSTYLQSRLIKLQMCSSAFTIERPPVCHSRSYTICYFTVPGGI